jgi:hypothetical protein
MYPVSGLGGLRAWLTREVQRPTAIRRWLHSTVVVPTASTQVLAGTFVASFRKRQTRRRRGRRFAICVKCCVDDTSLGLLCACMCDSRSLGVSCVLHVKLDFRTVVSCASAPLRPRPQFYQTLQLWVMNIDGSTHDLELMHGHTRLRCTKLTKFSLLCARHIVATSKRRFRITLQQHIASQHVGGPCADAPRKQKPAHRVRLAPHKGGLSFFFARCVLLAILH